MTKSLDIVELAMDEYEAIRLSDKEGLNMQDAARLMEISAPTFCRVLQSAHHKIALALTEGKSIKICTMCSK
jgi:predicted DNA-binding protein (UPF0251 family)